ncbi:polysaccharide deacetylase family protein [Bacteroidota bacterium]
MLFVKTPILIMKLFPELIWHLTSQEENMENHVFLTFDDGPTPEVTPWVLDCMKEYKAKATFFCLGRNVERYPKLYSQILDEGHAVGNHTYSHLKGWNTPNSEYINDIKLAGQIVDSNLFRPPYGRFKNSQMREIRKDYDIVMWDLISQDYDDSITPQKCLENVESNIKPGSIIVFHDSDKAKKNLYYTLPQILEKFSGEYEFLPIVKTPEFSAQRVAV